MQFLSCLGEGTSQEPLLDFGSERSKKTLKLPSEYITFEELPFQANSSIFSRVCTIDISDKMVEDNVYNAGIDKEYCIALLVNISL